MPLDIAHRIALVQSAETGFTDQAVLAGITYHYVITAVDQTGNESTASSEISIQPATPLQVWRAQNFSAADRADPLKEAPSGETRPIPMAISFPICWSMRSGQIPTARHPARAVSLMRMESSHSLASQR